MLLRHVFETIVVQKAVEILSDIGDFDKNGTLH